MSKWEIFINSWSMRGGQNFMLFLMTILFTVAVARKWVPPEMTLTPVITGMMAFMNHSGSQVPTASQNDTNESKTK